MPRLMHTRKPVKSPLGALGDMSEFQEFDRRLISLEGSVGTLGRRMESVESALNSHSTLLQEIRSAVTEERASRGPSLQELIRTVSSIATTAAIIATLLVYVATSAMSGPLTRLNEHLEFATQRIKDVRELEVVVAKSTLNTAVLSERVNGLTQRLSSLEEARSSWAPKIVSK